MPLGPSLPSIEQDRARRRRLVGGLLLANAAVAALLIVLVLLVLYASHRDYGTRARETAEGLTAIAQASVGSEFSRVDAMMRAALEEIEVARKQGPLRDETINQTLRAHQRFLPAVEGFRMTDAEGNVRWGNDLPGVAPVSVADRDYFPLAREQLGRVQVAGPLKSRVSGNWIVALVRPAVVDGRFAGVIYASVKLEHFQHLFAAYDLEPGDVMAIRTQDLRLVARHVSGKLELPDVDSAAVSQEMHAAMRLDPTRGVLVSRGAADGVERTSAYRQVEGWPFLVLVGMGNERFFAPWRAQVWQVSLLALAAWLLILGATWVVYAIGRRESRSVRALAVATRRTQALQRVAGDGIHIVDSRGRLVAMSDSFAEMLGSTREQMMGRHISSWDANQDEARIDAWLGKIRHGDRQQVDVQHRRDDGSVIDVELHLSVAEIEGELFVFSSARDVTERKRLLASLERLMREQTAMLDNDIVAMVKLQGRCAVWKNRALDRLFGYEPGELDGQSARILYPDDASFEAVGAAAYGMLAQGLHYRTQLQMRHKDGRLLWIDLSGVAIGDDLSFWMMVDISALKAMQARMEHIAFHDSLTQLPNRLLLADRMHLAIAAAQRSGSYVAVCYLDLDGFKQVNDEHGHDAGDALLTQIACRLQVALRSHDTAARVGGDEFVVLLTLLGQDGHEGPSEEWRPIAERLIAAIEEPVELAGGVAVQVSTSIGVALAPMHGVDAPLLLTLADQAMLCAKRAGKGRIALAGD